LAQADALSDLLIEMGQTLDHAIELQVNDDILVERILGRAADAVAAGGTARADDNEESLKTRLMAYYKQTSPLLGYYYAKGDLVGVDGLGTMDAVAADISKALLS
jgi:adenylate kinase